jgi:hypothetical protein
VTDDDWSETVEMLLGLDADPYSYDDITDNPWPFKIKNRGKENEYTHFSNSVFDCRVCVNIFKSCLPTPMTTPEQSAAHLTRGRSQRLMSSTFSREISCRTLSS